MDIISIVKNNWSGILTVLAIIIAIYQIFRNRNPNLRYKYFGQRLVAENGGMLPKQVKVSYLKKVVPRVSFTQLVIWNSGEAAIKVDNLSSNDPLLVSFDDGSILKAEIIKLSRDAIHANVSIDKTKKNAEINFEFLDRQDGLVLSILHTSINVIPKLNGTVIGMPRGIVNSGDTISAYEFFRASRRRGHLSIVETSESRIEYVIEILKSLGTILILFGSLIMFLTMFPEVFEKILGMPSTKSIVPMDGLIIFELVFYFLAGMFIFFCGVGIHFLEHRRPFPKSLNPKGKSWVEDDVVS